MTRQIECRADRDVLTLDELAAFVQDALRYGVAGTAQVSARVRIGGGLRSVRVGAASRTPDPKEDEAP